MKQKEIKAKLADIWAEHPTVLDAQIASFNFALELAAKEARKRQMKYPCDENTEFVDKDSIINLQLSYK